MDPHFDRPVKSNDEGAAANDSAPPTRREVLSMPPLLRRVVGAAKQAMHVCRRRGFWPMLGKVGQRLIQRVRPARSLRSWVQRYQPDHDLLQHFRYRKWSSSAPRFSVLMPVYNVREKWLRQAVESVLAQTYPHWELVCVNDGSTAKHIRAVLDDFAAAVPQVRVIHAPATRGVSASTNVALKAATGDYICFLDHDGYLEPQALTQFASAIDQDVPDILYSDEACTGENLEDIIGVTTRCQFSYDYYLSHPYFVHLVGVRTDLVRRIGGLNERMATSQDVDLMLRLFEVSQTISYVPDVLYRWRNYRAHLGRQQQMAADAATRGAIERHLARIGADAKVEGIEGLCNFRDVRFRSQNRARVAILIPTKNQAALLRSCVESLEKTVPSGLAEFFIIDHESSDPETCRYLQQVGRRYRVLPYRGPFNFSAIINRAVAGVRGPYTHYLLLNNDVRAIEPSWLEHMLGFAQRPDVGVVGATLLYPDGRVQHAGVVVGLTGHAEHAHKFWKFRKPFGARGTGIQGSMASNRDYSAVTAACMLVRSEVFEQANGFDESLEVEFGDTDFCLRVRALGYKVIQDAHAVLNHDESQTRAAGPSLGHPRDQDCFCRRYGRLIHNGDPFYSPLLSTITTHFALRPWARSPLNIKAVTGKVILPGPAAGATPMLAGPRGALKESA
jgi:GT2 family glycosyltransferase